MGWGGGGGRVSGKVLAEKFEKKGAREGFSCYFS